MSNLILPPWLQPKPEVKAKGGKGFVHEAAHEGSTNEWYTPPYIFKALGCTFDTDAASPEEGPVPWLPARRFITPSQDGLVTPYHGLTWCNPPYGPWVKRFAKCMAAHANGMMFVFGRTDVDWFQTYAFAATGICYLASRVQFVTRDGTMPISAKTGKVQDSPGVGSVIIYWGEVAEYHVVTSNLGPVVNNQRGVIHIPSNPVRFRHPGNDAVREHGWEILVA